jgi:hypothetical protein
MKDDEKEDKYYDYEAKGADSVFNLDDWFSFNSFYF